MQEIWVYTEKTSPRLAYVLSFISSIWEVKFQITNDSNEFSEISSSKINYSNLAVDGIQIKPHKLLFENEIKLFDFTSLETDSLAMIFFLLSRYEEYVITTRDKHHRFEGKTSYLFNTNRLHIPWVDVLVNNLKNALLEKYPQTQFKPKHFKKQLTIDIDQAYLYKNKGFKRFLGANLRDAAKLNFKQIVDRKLPFFGFKTDPWDIYENVKSKFKEINNPPIFFFQVGDYGEFDKNINHKNKGVQKLIQQTASWTTVGLHPSYQSNHQPLSILKIEKERLQEITGKSVVRSRQHYIKLFLPSTYRFLLEIGITDDYSMGFTDEIGFRAGTSNSFNWYDLSNEEETKLKIHPFCVMDVTLKNYLQLAPQQAKGLLIELSTTIEEYGGTFCMICHNESLSGFGEWKTWKDIFLSAFTSEF